LELGINGIIAALNVKTTAEVVEISLMSE